MYEILNMGIWELIGRELDKDITTGIFIFKKSRSYSNMNMEWMYSTKEDTKYFIFLVTE
jgi:hypothetical protein